MATQQSSHPLARRHARSRSLTRLCGVWAIAFCFASLFATLAGCGSDGGDGVGPFWPGTDGDGGTAGTGGGGNHPPTASLRVTPEGPYLADGQITLDASGSADPDGDALTYAWSQPQGPAATFESQSGTQATVRLPRVVYASQLTFRVTVNDGRNGSAFAQADVSITVPHQFAGHAQSALPYRNELTSDEAWHLLRRAAFGAKPQEVAAAVQNGLSATLDDLFLNRPIPPEVLAVADSYLDNMHFRWLYLMVEGPNPLREQLSLFWHDRFATSQREVILVDRPLALEHLDMLRTNCLGDYRQFLDALTTNRLMLFWLNGADSPIAAPNENYAREFWELFTLGRDVLYTEQDIRESARAFTGFRLIRPPGETSIINYDPAFHDPGLMSVFPARTSPRNYNYADIINLTLDQPEAARFVARNLFTYFIHDHPTDAVIDELADAFRESGYQLDPLVRRVLSCQAFFSEEARGSLLTSPVEHWVGICRTLDMHIHSDFSRNVTLLNVAAMLASGGQELMNPVTVFGWDEGLGWVTDHSFLMRIIALTERMEFGPNRSQFLPYHLLPPQSVWWADGGRELLVDTIAAVYHLELSPEERQIYIDMLFHPNTEEVSDVIKLMAVDERMMTR